jgi:hypothetical protein
LTGVKHFCTLVDLSKANKQVTCFNSKDFDNLVPSVSKLFCGNETKTRYFNFCLLFSNSYFKILRDIGIQCGLHKIPCSDLRQPAKVDVSKNLKIIAARNFDSNYSLNGYTSD